MSEDRPDPYESYRDSIAFAIERDRLWRSTVEPPRPFFKERTPDRPDEADIADALRNIDDAGQAALFVEGAQEAAKRYLLRVLEEHLAANPFINREPAHNTEMWRKILGPRRDPGT